MKNGGKRQKTSISARFWVRKHPKSGRNAQQNVFKIKKNINKDISKVKKRDGGGGED